MYQRNYDWKRDNCKQLFDDLVALIKDDKSTHFFGSVVSFCHKQDEIILIDGQQRITTISIILIAMVNLMKKGVFTSEESTLCQRIEETYIIDRFAKDKRKVRLKPFRNDCEAFDRLIFKNESDYLVGSNITVNYNYFYDRIVNAKELTMDELYRAVLGLEIINIVLEPDHGDNPQLIFESLNSTGLDLTESDKIRNYVLMNLDPITQEKYYDEYWNRIERNSEQVQDNEELDNFIRNYLTIVTGLIPTLKGIYSAFKLHSKAINDTEHTLQEMVRYSESYKRLVSFNVGNAKANEVAKRLSLMEMTVADPFLMAFITYASDVHLEGEEIFRTFSCVETFIFRRLMCDLPTNALNKIFATLHNSVLKNKKETDSYSSVMIFLLESKKLSSAFPKDDEFLNGFTTKNIYSMKGKNKEYLFDRLENGSSVEKNDIVTNMESGILTVEHIMPQNLSNAWKVALGENWTEIQEKWLHTISNLTLTGYNSTYSNKSFSEKKNAENGFLHSGLRLNHYISNFDKWSEEELETRKRFLSGLALHIWEYPFTSFAPEIKEEDIVYLSEDNGVATGRKISYYEFRDEKTSVSDWVEMMWLMVKQLLEINPEILYQAASDNVWFSSKNEDKHYRKLADRLYFCPSQNNTWNKMALLKKLFKIYQIDEDELSFGLKPIKNEKEDE